MFRWTEMSKSKRKSAIWPDLLLFVGSLIGLASCSYLVAMEFSLVNFDAWSRLRGMDLGSVVINDLHLTYCMIWVICCLVCVRLGFTLFRSMSPRGRKRYLYPTDDGVRRGS